MLPVHLAAWRTCSTRGRAVGARTLGPLHPACAESWCTQCVWSLACWARQAGNLGSHPTKDTLTYLPPSSHANSPTVHVSLSDVELNGSQLLNTQHKQPFIDTYHRRHRLSASRSCHLSVFVSLLFAGQALRLLDRVFFVRLSHRKNNCSRISSLCGDTLVRSMLLESLSSLTSGRIPSMTSTACTPTLLCRINGAAATRTVLEHSTALVASWRAVQLAASSATQIEGSDATATASYWDLANLEEKLGQCEFSREWLRTRTSSTIGRFPTGRSASTRTRD